VDGTLIDVVADGGEVLLRGTVGSFWQKREAQMATKCVDGVTNVDNIIDVRLLTEHRRADAELRADVLHALSLNGMIPSTVDASVNDGIVLLSGTVDLEPREQRQSTFSCRRTRTPPLTRRDRRPRRSCPTAGGPKFAYGERVHLAQPSHHRAAVAELRLLLLEIEQAAGQTLRHIHRPTSEAAKPITQPTHVLSPRQPVELPSSPARPTDAGDKRRGSAGVRRPDVDRKPRQRMSVTRP
jgi:hypothetical protein